MCGDVFFNLLLNAIKEHTVDPAQRVFWHAGATTNHLYIHQEWFQRGFDRLTDALEEDGLLPAGAELRIIPTLSCQLFATRPDSLEILEELIACWRDGLWRRRDRAERFLAAFQHASAPGEVVDELFRELETPFVADLGRLLARSTRSTPTGCRSPTRPIPSTRPTTNTASPRRACAPSSRSSPAGSPR